MDVPVVPATSAGSLPPTPELAAARSPDGEAPAEAVKAAVAYWMAKQEELGLDVLVDGELDRAGGIAWFAGRLRGVEPGGLVRVEGDRFSRRPVIAGEVKWNGPITVETWKHARSLTAKPVKAAIPGPYSLMDSSFIERYPTRRAACLALAREVRQEAEALVEAGCRIVQLDEPALGGRPGELDLAADAIGTVTRGLAAYTIVHACYGPIAASWKGLAALPADNLYLECANSDFAVLGPMSSARPACDVTFGVSDVLSVRIDSPEAVLRRVRKTLTLLKPEQVWAAPDCGLRDRTPEEAIGQLAAVAAAAREARRGRGG